MRKSSKRAQVVPISIVPSGGIDFSTSSSEIPTNSLRSSLNGQYLPGSTAWQTRPGIRALSTNGSKLAGEIKVIRPHYNGTTTYLIGVSGGKVYYMTKAVAEGAFPTWTEISGSSVSTSKPAMISFNSCLYIADGDGALKFWNAAGTWGSVTNGPQDSTCLVEARNRVWTNSTSNPDALYASPSEWANQDWTTGSGNLTLRGGYGDGMNVVAFANAPGGNDIIISKSNADLGQSCFRRITVTDATPANWKVSDAFGGIASQPSAYAMARVYNDIIFMAADGIYSMQGVQEYGDFSVSASAGAKINGLFATLTGLTVEELYYSTELGALFIFLDGKANFYVYTPFNGAFNVWNISEIVFTSACTINGTLYLSDTSGLLYRLTDSATVDITAWTERLIGGAYATGTNIGSSPLLIGELGIATQTYFSSQVRSKKINFGGYDGKLVRSNLVYEAISAGTGGVEAYLDDELTAKTIRSFTFDVGQDLINSTYSTSTYVGAATDHVGMTTVGAISLATRGGPRDKGIQMNVKTSAGRIRISRLDAEFSAPLGG